ncbi:MAG TPA: hypothetical protein VNQ52_12785, partial [Microbacteriaceae bacterium]|nr:hypothetical protein [Microbacteriaceae bacterium]
WDGGRILLEADGRAKYADPSLRGERTAEEVLWAQKRREDALQAGCERFGRMPGTGASSPDGSTPLESPAPGARPRPSRSSARPLMIR